MWGTYWLSHSTWQRYQRNPTVISMERDYKEWNSSFPALTLCPTTKFDQTSIENLIESRYRHLNDSDRLASFFMTLANASYSSFKEFRDDYDPIPAEEYLSAAYETRFNFTYNMSNTHVQEFSNTQLAPIFTEMGICFSFNSHLSPYLHPSYTLARNRTFIPMQPLLMGHPMSGETLAQLMNINSGYMLYIHSPNDSADIATTGFESSMYNFKTVIAVPLTIYSSNDVKQLSVSQRRCRFMQESNLKISPAYSFKFCRMECRMRLSLKLCGCVPFFYPPTGEPICNVRGMKCLAKYEEELIKLHDLKKHSLDCNCYPACDDVSFVIDSVTNMYWFLGTNLNVCLVKYPRMRLRRDLLFGIVEVLGNFSTSPRIFQRIVPSSPNSNRRSSLPNPGKPSRQSLSILKPLKARNPLQDLDLVPNVDDDTTTTTTSFNTLRRRRVSFAGVNQVKEFHTAAESLTVHHTPAYDELIMTTMSSDSSGHHHLTDSKISDATALTPSRFSSGPNLTNMDAVLDLTVKSSGDQSFKPEEQDFEGKENFTDHFRPPSQNTFYEADMECTTPHAAFYESENFSFVNKSMEFTSVVSGFADRSLSKSVMEFTEVIRAPIYGNENATKQYESMEFTQQVTGEFSAYDPEFFDPSESNNDSGEEIASLVPQPNIFMQQPADVQVNSIFSQEKSSTDFNDSMSFGVTGVISQPLIECLKNADNFEANQENSVCGSFIEPANQGSRAECSNAEGSEMELTEANAFSDPQIPAPPVADSLEAVRKTIFDNFKTKPTNVLSALRKKVAAPTQGNRTLDWENLERSQENQADSSHGNSHNFSISKSQTMEFTTALPGNIRANSYLDQSVSKTSMELTNAVPASLSKSASIELTKAVSINIKPGDSNTSFTDDFMESNVVFDASLRAKEQDLEAINNRSKNFERPSEGDAAQVAFLSKEKCLSSFDTVNFNASNVITSTQESRTSVGRHVEEGVNQFTEENYNISVRAEHFTKQTEGKFGGETVDFDATNVATSTQEAKPENGPVAVDPIANKVPASDSINFDAASAITSTQKSRVSHSVPTASDTRKSLSVEAFLNFPGMPVGVDLRHVHDGNVASKPNLNLSQPSIHETEAKNNSVCSQDTLGSQPMDFTTLNTRKPNNEFSSESQTVGNQHRETVELEPDFGGLPGSQPMELTCARSQDVKSTLEVSSGSIAGSQPMEFTDVFGFEKADPEVGSQSIGGSQSMEFTNVHGFDGKVAQNLSGSHSMEALLTEQAISQDISGNQSMEFTNAHAFNGELLQAPENTCGNQSKASAQNISVNQAMDLTNSYALEAKMSKGSLQSFSNSQQTGHVTDQSPRSFGSDEKAALIERSLLEDKSSSCSVPGGKVSFGGCSGDSSGRSPMEVAKNSSNSRIMDNSPEVLTQVGGVKDKRRNRRSELFVPMQEPILHSKMSFIEESEVFNNSWSSENEKPGRRNCLSSLNISDQTEDIVRSTALITPKAVNVATGDPECRSLLENFDCSYKINESHTKSMMERTSHDEFNTSEAMKPNFESEAYDPLNSLFVSKTYDSFSHKVLSGHPVGSVKSGTDGGAVSPHDALKSMFQFSGQHGLDPNEATQNFSRLMKSALEDSGKKATFSSSHCSMANVFEESGFTIPIENIPRTVFLSDEVDCPTLTQPFGAVTGESDTCGDSAGNSNVVTAGSLEVDGEQKFEGDSSVRKIESEIYTRVTVTEVAAKCDSNAVSIIQTQQKEISAVIKINNESGLAVENEPPKLEGSKFNYENSPGKSIENQFSELDISCQKNLCDESFPASEFTINEDMLKNITISRHKPRKDLRKSRCLADLDNSITRQHDEDIKKVRISEDLCDITGIARLADLTVDLSKVSPLAKKATSGEDNKIDSSMSEFDQNGTKIQEDFEHLQISVQSSVQAVPDIIPAVPEPPPADMSLVIESVVKTPKSILKKTNKQSILMSAPAPDSEAKQVYLQGCSGPKKRGFVKNAARLYDSFVATTSPSEKDLTQCKRSLDESYVKTQKPLLKKFLDNVTPSLNGTLTIRSDVDVVDVEPVAKEAVDTSLKYVTISPREGFEKTNYTPLASSNTSMICNDRSFVSPSLKTPMSIFKSTVKAEVSPMSPKSPARKRQRLPFVSTPIKSSGDGEKAEVVLELGSQPDFEMICHDSGSSQKSLGAPQFCREFMERFEADTKTTKKEWKVLEASSTLWSFEFLDGHLRLTIHFKAGAARGPTPVQEIAFFSVNSEDDPKQVICENIILEKYPPQRLKSICRNASNVFNVLHMIASDVVFARKVKYSLDGMLVGNFTNNSVMIELTSVRPNHLAEVTVDLSSWQSLSASSITVENFLGALRPQKIKSLFEECDKNHDCIRQFYRKCRSYMESISFTGPSL